MSKLMKKALVCASFLGILSPLLTSCSSGGDYDYYIYALNAEDYLVLDENNLTTESSSYSYYINGYINMPQIKDNALRFTDEKLEQNYNMSVDSSAELGLTPSAEEHHKTR